jgi:hypothetical protein
MKWSELNSGTQGLILLSIGFVLLFYAFGILNLGVSIALICMALGLIAYGMRLTHMHHFFHTVWHAITQYCRKIMSDRNHKKH